MIEVFIYQGYAGRVEIKGRIKGKEYKIDNDVATKILEDRFNQGHSITKTKRQRILRIMPV